MARIGNETKLILRLAKEQMSQNPKLAEEINFRSRGDVASLKWEEILKIGYNTGKHAYEFTLDNIVTGLEK